MCVYDPLTVRACECVCGGVVWCGVVWCVCVFTRPIKGVSGRLADRVVWGGEARRGRGRGEEAEQGRATGCQHLARPGRAMRQVFELA